MLIPNGWIQCRERYTSLCSKTIIAFSRMDELQGDQEPFVKSKSPGVSTGMKGCVLALSKTMVIHYKFRILSLAPCKARHKLAATCNYSDSSHSEQYRKVARLSSIVGNIYKLIATSSSSAHVPPPLPRSQAWCGASGDALRCSESCCRSCSGTSWESAGSASPCGRAFS
jgi:hypothetical protein